MNNDLSETQALITDLKSQTKTTNAEIMIAPAFTNLYSAFDALRETSILFAVLIGIVIFNEKITKQKIIAGLFILSGLVVMRL